MPVTLAAVASIPRRAHLLPESLGSLRPQVDRLHVYLNGYDEVPDCVRDLADEYVLDRENGGAEKKLHWSDWNEGIYLSCDDDFVYVEDYVATMVAAVEQWGGRAIVTAHGRSYRGRSPRNVHDVVPGSLGIIHKRVDEGRWVNHGGTGVMAWDARVIRVPSSWPLKNCADMQLAIWAQNAGVPMWLIPHKAHWLRPLAMLDPEGIFKTAQREGFRRRNELLWAHGAEKGWVIYEPSDETASA